MRRVATIVALAATVVAATTPASAGTTPATAGTTLAQAGTMPASAATTPATAGTTLAQAGTMPATVTTTPAAATTTRASAGTTPAQAGTTPAQAGTTPATTRATRASAAGTLISAARALARHAGPRTSYYLSLGDSLSQGVQPDAAGASLPTQQGYPDQLYAVLHPGDPGLRLVKLGCSGETTHTMIDGGICSYRAGSQLAEAARFLRAHRGQLSLITIDIGANDPDSCISRPSIGAVASCVTKSFPATVANLTKIMSTIRAAAGRRVRIIGMNYYVPALAEWRNGFLGRELARLSERLVVYDRLLASVYQKFGARVANVFGAFHSGDFTGQVRVPGVGTLPRNVAAVCLWTWECAPAPRGPNEHARAIGYGVIALAFLLAEVDRAKLTLVPGRDAPNTRTG